MTKAPLYLLAGIAANLSAQEAKRWNIVHIMSDDHSYQAISAYGHALSRQARTDNIDRLAEEGVYFRNAFCASPVCSPARCSIVTIGSNIDIPGAGQQADNAGNDKDTFQ